MSRPWISLADGQRLLVSDHAAQRYRARVCPDLEPDVAIEHLRQLAALAGEQARRPSWLAERPGNHSGDRLWWASLGPDVFLLVERRLVVTVVVRKIGRRRGGVAQAMVDGITERLRNAA